ncbi:zinc transport system permease protein [Desulfobotulus alkaliphilus]|uniref:Zinc transport system permease protein n=1 Tax=Desulfobotulus alkaliphilus TaxID=622671 RepID=A0A562RGB7_9BACT|nr:metal ABC transporter permease [Desulfobotulus alkaliphilus]TWI68112.1 zinc transport system permease protein [Desulfobotulus alkaliphilus]
MSSLISVLFDPDIVFLRYAFAAGILSSISFGVVGSYVVARRISTIAGAIAHCVLGGIGFALFMQERSDSILWTPLTGALMAALMAAFIIGLVSLRAGQREDTVINALWAVGMAIGLLFMARTSGYIDPMSFLFGNILMIGPADLQLMGIMAAFIILMVVLFYNKLVAVCFDEEFLELRGVPAHFYYFMLLVLTALSIVLLIRVVGIVLVIAMLTLPAAIAGQLSRSLAGMMGLAVLFSMGFTTGGIALSFETDLPTGPVIVVLAAASYLCLLIYRFIDGRLNKTTLHSK